MIIGILTFSFATGSLSSILAQVDVQSADLLAKRETLEKMKVEYKMSEKLFHECLNNLSYSLSNNSDYAILLSEFPKKLRDRVSHASFKQVR
jgi:hypothetical protein